MAKLPVSESALDNHEHRQTTHCKFLAMPPEIRNHIYELLFPHYEPADLLGDGLLILESRHVASKGLLLTCRQIYHEAKLVYHTARPGTRYKLVLANEWDAQSQITRIRQMDERLLRRIWRLEIATERRNGNIVT